ncbi:MAG: glycosyltransferase [Eubacteriales bacterium]|nr:glycosyltransferase [Eubacteriales bacterium]
MPAKVAFFIGTLSKGGAERAVSNLTRKLPDEIEKTILLYGTQNRIDYPVAGKIEYIDAIKKNSVLNKFLSILTRTKRLKKFKQDNPGTVFISFLEYPNLLNLLTAKWSRTIISVRNHMSTKNGRSLKGLFWKITIHLFYNRADLIIAVTEDIKRDLVDHFGIDEQKIQVIYNYYHLDQIREQGRQTLDPLYETIYQSPVIVTMGRMNWQKGQWHLIRSFASVKKQHQDLQLVILGEGRLERDLKELAQQLGVAESVHFPGFQKNPYPFIKNAKIFVLPSLVEGFPNALVEAMALGIPVIAADCHSGPREILAPDSLGIDLKYPCDDAKNNYGLIVSADMTPNQKGSDKLSSAECELAKALNDLLNDFEKSKTYGKKSLLRSNDFNINHVIQAWETLIKQNENDVIH